MQLTMFERESLQAALESDSVLRQLLDRFCSEQQLRNQGRCAENMRRVPRNPELAADYAAKAEAYREFVSLLERELQV